MSGQVCFTCYFLEGSQSQGCYIEYNSFITDCYSGNITIERRPEDASTASKCVSLSNSKYTVTFNDLGHDTSEYAVKVTNQLVSGIFTITTKSVTSSICSVINVNSTSSSPILHNSELS